jgi:hypothetical protein
MNGLKKKNYTLHQTFLYGVMLVGIFGLSGCPAPQKVRDLSMTELTFYESLEKSLDGVKPNLQKRLETNLQGSLRRKSVLLSATFSEERITIARNFVNEIQGDPDNLTPERSVSLFNYLLQVREQRQQAFSTYKHEREAQVEELLGSFTVIESAVATLRANQKQIQAALEGKLSSFDFATLKEQLDELKGIYKVLKEYVKQRRK